VQTLVWEGSPSVKLRNSARKGVPKRREDDHASDPLPRPDHTGPAILENLGAARACREGAVRGLDPGAAHGTPYIEATRALHAAMARHTTRLQDLAILAQKVDFSRLGYHPDLEPRLTL